MPQPRVLAVMLRSMARQTSAREGCCSTGAGGTLRALSACVPAPTARGLVCCQSRGRSCAVRRRTCSRAAPSSRAQRGGGRMNGHTAQHPGRAMSARARRPPALRRVQLAALHCPPHHPLPAWRRAAQATDGWPPLPRTTSTSRSSAAVGRQSAASRACLTCLTTGHRPLTAASDHLLPACCPPAARPTTPRLACAPPDVSSRALAVCVWPSLEASQAARTAQEHGLSPICSEVCPARSDHSRSPVRHRPVQQLVLALTTTACLPACLPACARPRLQSAPPARWHMPRHTPSAPSLLYTRSATTLARCPLRHHPSPHPQSLSAPGS